MVSHKRGYILLIILGTLLIVVLLTAAILAVVSSQSRLTHHQVSRIKAYYAGKAMMNYTLEMLRLGTWSLPATGSVYYACHRNCVDSVTEDYDIPTDNDIPYDVQVAIHPANWSPFPNCTTLQIKTEYTYTNP